MKKAVRLISWLLILSLCAVFTAASGACAETGKKHTTVLVYMCGADLESRNRQATRSMGDMIASKFNRENVNVVILAGGARFWSGKYDTGKLTLLTIEGRRPAVVDEFSGASMGEAETLSLFLNTCYERYPAEHYDLILWDHGGGPNSGVCFDSLYDDDSLTLPELQQALADSPFGKTPLDLLVFHACLMGSAEVADAISPYARYMVAGEDSIYGLSYEWLADLEKDPDAQTTARRIVDSSFSMNGDTIRALNASERNAFAAIDLSRMGQIVEQMDAFFPKVSVNLNEASFTTMSGDRRGAVCFGVGESGPDTDYDLVDLGDLIKRYRSMGEEEADALLSMLSDAVYCHAEPDSGCTGLTVYHPFENKRAVADRMTAYGALGFSRAYTEYIRQFASLLLGVPMTTWDDMETGEPQNRATFSTFMVRLNGEQTRHLSGAKLCVLMKCGEDAYQLICTDPETACNDGVIRGEYDGSALYAVDAAGQPLSAPLEYRVDARGNYLIPAELDSTGEDGAPYTQQALIVCVPDGDSMRLDPRGVLVWEENVNGYTTAFAATFRDYETIRISGVARRETKNDRGERLSFDEWETVETGEVWQKAIDDSWTFALLNDTLPRESLYVTFQLQDSQNNAYSSSLYPIVKPAIDVFVEYNNDQIETVRLDTDQFIAKADESRLRVSGPVLYSGEEEIIINVGNLAVNQTKVSDDTVAVIYGAGPNWGLLAGETQPMSVLIDMERFDQTLEYQEITFDLTAVDAASGETTGTVAVSVRLKTAVLSAEEA